MKTFAIIGIAVFCLASTAMADIVAVGNTTPEPTDAFWSAGDWTFTTPVNVGYGGAGSVLVDGGSVFSLGGLRVDAEGVVTVAGAGAALNNCTAEIMCASGEMNVTDGGQIVMGGGTIVYSTGVITIDGINSIWQNYNFSDIHGELHISDGGKFTEDFTCTLGGAGIPNSTSLATVDGIGSMLSTGEDLWVGYFENAVLDITNGGVVNGYQGVNIGVGPNSTGVVTVDGIGSALIAGSQSVSVGGGLGDYLAGGDATLNIFNEGLVITEGLFVIDDDGDGDSVVNMATGGMLAIEGQADSSLMDFYTLIAGTDAVRYWDESLSDWAMLTGATYGDDYSLDYYTDGDLAGYTVLTVSAPVPEPATMSLLAVGGVVLLKRKR